MKKLFFFSLPFLFAIVLLPKSASAVSFPVKELGNCRDAQECYYFCQIAQNSPICWSYATYVLHTNVLSDTTTNPDEEAKAKGITFPVAELGNCSSAASCMQYCDRPENHDVCTAFAQKKGLTQMKKPPQQPTIDTGKFLSDAKTTLGCDSMDACRQFCGSIDNKEKCRAFAESEGISTPKPSVTPTSLPANIFEVTKTELGCDSLVSCKQVCAKSENYQKCTEFAKAHNLTARPQQGQLEDGHESSASGSSSFSQKNDAPPADKISIAQKFGCATSQECEQFCKEHVGLCPGFPYASSSGTFQFHPFLRPSAAPTPYPGAFVPRISSQLPYPSSYQTSGTRNFQGITTSEGQFTPPAGQKPSEQPTGTQ